MLVDAQKFQTVLFLNPLKKKKKIVKTLKRSLRVLEERQLFFWWSASGDQQIRSVNKDHAEAHRTHQRYWRCTGRWCAAGRPAESWSRQILAGEPWQLRTAREGEWDSGLQCGEVPRLAQPATPRQQQHSSPQLDCQVHRERRSSPPPLLLSPPPPPPSRSFSYLSSSLNSSFSFRSAPLSSQLFSEGGRAPPNLSHRCSDTTPTRAQRRASVSHPPPVRLRRARTSPSHLRRPLKSFICVCFCHSPFIMSVVTNWHSTLCSAASEKPTINFSGCSIQTLRVWPRTRAHQRATRMLLETHAVSAGPKGPICSWKKSEAAVAATHTALDLHIICCFQTLMWSSSQTSKHSNINFFFSIWDSFIYFLWDKLIWKESEEKPKLLCLGKITTI